MELDDRPDLAQRLKDAIPAATLIAMRPSAAGGPDEILVVERSSRLAFAGGMIAFPGGRVEAADGVLAQRLAPGLPPAEASARVAALRETFEETGLLCGLRGDADFSELEQARAELLAGADFAALLADRGWALDPAALMPFARWCPPAEIVLARRFDARFYLVRAPAGAPVSPDRTENAASFWASAGALIEDAEGGRLKILGPTRATLMRLAMGRGYADARTSALEFPVREILPVVRSEGGERWAGVPAGHGYPDVDFRLR
ncbi:NUDIX hydrolase [Croceicoccus marinus]|uniref:NUDIX domain-containing protein n=1 Tax=Croceicoccus marinus TaxID=450378 RepID=A0A7G6VSC6_9SPHN|nr:NUDIX domain-containing protein [Croceicoccus marinus]QNE04641.1 NUDIX domain-containing protein [Croceicoccus marinus]